MPLPGLSGAMMLSGAGGTGGGPGLTWETPILTSVVHNSVYTFLNQSIGAAASNRLVVVTISALTLAGTTLTGLTIGGISATNIKTQVSTDGTGHTSIWAATVPTGTTATIVVTFSAIIGEIAASVWAGNVLSAIPRTTGSVSSGSTISGVGVIGGSAVIGVGNDSTGATFSPSWSGADPVTTRGSGSLASDFKYIFVDVDATEANTCNLAFGSSGGSPTKRAYSLAVWDT